MSTPATSAKERWRAFTAREGKRTLIVLAIITLVGFGLRFDRVVHPLAKPGDDALAYRALAESLYEEGTYGGESFTDASDWSPGAPLLYAGAYYATGGVRDGVGRGVEAILGTLAILVVYLLTRRIGGCRPAALIAAGMTALYPPFIHSTGALLSEPPAFFTLPAAVLAFLWADERGKPVAWLLPGLLFGATALIRPEYLFVGIVFAAFALVREWRRAGRGAWRRPVAAAAVFVAAFAAVLIPWTIHNYVTLDRVVPISTGSGKALYVGTNLEADGDYQRVKALLVKRYLGRDLEPDSPQLDAVNPTPLFNRVAERYPDLTRDAALGKIGKEQLKSDLTDHPVDYAAMTVRKIGRMWGTGFGPVMESRPGRLVQLLILAFALAGFAILCTRRRWEAIAFAIPITVVTAIGAISLAANRRNEILMTLIFPLAAVAITRLGALARGRMSAS